MATKQQALGGVAMSSRLAGMLALLAVGFFHLAYAGAGAECSIFLFLTVLCLLAGIPSTRGGFYYGLCIGLAIYAPQLSFFWKIFGPGAVALWLILALWLALFLLLAKLMRERYPPYIWMVAMPFLWMGLEYFRSEIYYLKFSWLNVGYVFSNSAGLTNISFLGMYGVGFALMMVAALLARSGVLRAIGGGALVVLALFLVTSTSKGIKASKVSRLKVAGVQLEFPGVLEVEQALDKLYMRHPQADLLVLSEYTFDGPVPGRILNWCKKRSRYLMAGGKVPSGTEFFNTAFVVSPEGKIVFEQVKCVPIQFFKDGYPASQQNVWDSPWGKLGICICYDFSYRRVTDQLVMKGAQALIVPTMDVAEWGASQHKLHARVALVRAAEYQLPVFRLASSGISQGVDCDGHQVASAPFPGEGEMLYAELAMPPRGRMPVDHWLAPISVGIAGLFIVGLGIKTRRKNP